MENYFPNFGAIIDREVFNCNLIGDAARLAPRKNKKIEMKNYLHLDILRLWSLTQWIKSITSDT